MLVYTLKSMNKLFTLYSILMSVQLNYLLYYKCPNVLLSIIILITGGHNKTFGALFYYIMEMDHNNYYTSCIIAVYTL